MESHAKTLQGTKVHHSSEPQLCVCLGIVEDAMQTINSNIKMFQRRISAVSLGISCFVRYQSMALYSASKRDLQEEAKEQAVITDKDSDGNRWIKGYMNWFVRRVRPSPYTYWQISRSMANPCIQGAVIQDDKSIKQPFSIAFAPNVAEEDRVGFVRIKTCNVDPIPRLDNNRKLWGHRIPFDEDDSLTKALANSGWQTKSVTPPF